MATFVLVPGGWSGGWAWKWVTPFIRAAGHEVAAITLTGLGDRAHLAHRDVGLDTHIEDVVTTLHYSDLQNVFLVGWSYGGCVITGVVDKAPERVAHLVYLDNNRPKHGQSLIDFVEPTWWAARQKLTDEQGAGWRVPIQTHGWADPEALSEYIADPVVRDWCIARVVPQPIKTFTQSVSFTNPDALARPHTHIVCVQNGQSMEELAQQQGDIEREQGGRYRALASNHLCVWTTPQLVAEALLALI
jgi:pimeloyl-ACP methyl ester carboxylesterase